jgi:beta-mannosidase
LVLWLRDTRPGQGWGVIDHGGRPKAAYHHLRRALAPVAVWTTDEGLAGVAVHVANDRAEPLAATLRVRLYRDFELPVNDAIEQVELGSNAATSFDVEGLLGRFVDASYAYRFGPPQHNVIVASLERDGELISQAFHFPAGRPAGAQSAAELGLEVELSSDPTALLVRSRRLAYGVRVDVPGFSPADDAFSVEPGSERRIALRPVAGEYPAEGRLTAINLEGGIPIPPAG